MSTLQVDRIIPYQSASVSIVGAIQADGATTGSNTFTGDQNIQGTLTASLQEGYVWVGGPGDISVLVESSSFGGGSGFPFEGNAVISGSLEVTGSFKTAADGTSATGTIFTQNVGTGGRTNLTFSQPTFNSSAQIAQNPNTGGGVIQISKTGYGQGVINLDGNTGNVNITAATSLSPEERNSSVYSAYFESQNASGSVDRRLIMGVASINHPSPDLTGHVPYIAITTDTGFEEVTQYQDPSTYTDGTITNLVPVQMNNVLRLSQQDPLPTGADGELAVSGSNLYFFSGSAWNQIN